MIGKFDKDGSGRIDFHEFLDIMMIKMSERNSTSELENAFKLFDIDGDNVITFDDLKKVATELGEDMTDEELREMISNGATKGEKEGGVT